MSIRVPSRTRLEKYGYVQRGDEGGPLDVACPTLIEPANGAFVLQENVSFAWGDVNGATSYNFYLWESDAPEPQPINTTSLSYSATLTFGTAYRWRVNAVNDFGESSGCTYGLVFPDLPDGKSGYNEFEVNQGFVSLEDDLYVVEDSEGSVTINVIRQGSAGAASVHYATEDGTAIAPTNYTDTSGTADWGATVSGAFPVEIPIELLETTVEETTDYIVDWTFDQLDPRTANNAHEYRAYLSGTSTQSWRETREEALDDLRGLVAANISASYVVPDVSFGWQPVVSQSITYPYDVAPPTTNYVLLRLTYSPVAVSAQNVAHDGSITDTNIFSRIGVGQTEWVSSWYNAGTLRNSRAFRVLNSSASTPTGFTSVLLASNIGLSFSPDRKACSLNDVYIEMRRVASAPPIPGAEFPDWEHCPAHFTYDAATNTLYSKAPWVKVFGNYHWLQTLNQDDPDSQGPASPVNTYPLGPVVLAGSDDDNEAFWTAAYSAAVAAGTAPAGRTYVAAGTGGINTYPRDASYIWRREYKMPKNFLFGLSNAVNATIIEPDEAVVWIVSGC